MSSLVWGFSLFRCSWHMRPSSLKASLMSRTLRRSRALLAILLSRSRSAFCSGFRSSSSVILWRRKSSCSQVLKVNVHYKADTSDSCRFNNKHRSCNGYFFLHAYNKHLFVPHLLESEHLTTDKIKINA